MEIQIMTRWRVNSIHGYFRLPVAYTVCYDNLEDNAPLDLLSLLGIGELSDLDNTLSVFLINDPRVRDIFDKYQVHALCRKQIYPMLW